MTTLAMAYPMLTVMDYPEAVPEARACCPRCRTEWERYNGMWEAEDAMTSSRYPVGFGKCRACAWEERTDAQLLGYIKVNDLGVKVMQYMMTASGQTANEWIWRSLLPVMLDSMPDEMAQAAADYIEDNDLKSDFVDYLMEV